MKSTAPWSVKGIERGARDVAKEAAKREGKTVGEWLNQMIYHAGEGETDVDARDVDGVKLKDVVTAIDHLNHRIIEASDDTGERINQLSKTIGGAVERIQRLERAPGEGAHAAEIAERVERLERNAAREDRIDALKALEKAVSQVAVQFKASQEAAAQRLEENEARFDALARSVSASGASDSDVDFLRDSIEGLSVRIGKTEKKLAESANGASDEFAESTTRRMRVLGEEIKRGGDQIQALEGEIAKLATKIDAAEHRSAEGIQKTAETLAELQTRIAAGDGGERRANVEELIAERAIETEKRVTAMQRAFERMIDRLESVGGTGAENHAHPAAPDAAAKPAVAPAPASEKSAGSASALTEPSTEEESAEGVKSDAGAVDEDDDFFSFADDIEVAVGEGSPGDDFSFELSNDDRETSGDALEESLLTEPTQEGVAAKSFDNELSDSELGDDLLGDDPTPETEASAPDDESVESEAPETVAKAPDDAPRDDAPPVVSAPEDGAQSEQGGADSVEPPRERTDDEKAAIAARALAKSRNLTPKQKAILAARIKKQRELAKQRTQAPVADHADNETEAGAGLSAPIGAKARGDAAQAVDDPSDDEADEPLGFRERISKARGAVLGKFQRNRRSILEEDGDAADDDPATATSGAFVESEPDKTSALAARPVALALGGAILLAVALLFFMIKDLIFVADETPAPTAAAPAPAITEAPPASSAPAPTASLPADAPAQPSGDERLAAPSVTLRGDEASATGPVVDPAALYATAMASIENAPDANAAEVAVQELRQSALLGHPPAQLQLGEFYKTGQFVDENLVDARTWFRRAANGGNVLAMHRIGVMTARGEGGPANAEEAIGWFELAAEFGLVDSQYNLGAIYHPIEGEGANDLQDPEEAYFWYKVASANGDAQAGELANDVASLLSTEQLSAADQRLASFVPQIPDETANAVIAPRG